MTTKSVGIKTLEARSIPLFTPLATTQAVIATKAPCSAAWYPDSALRSWKVFAERAPSNPSKAPVPASAR